MRQDSISHIIVLVAILIVLVAFIIASLTTHPIPTIIGLAIAVVINLVLGTRDRGGR